MASLGYINLGKHEPVQPKNQQGPLIKHLRAYVIGSKELEEKSGGGGDCHSQGKGHWIVDTMISNPMSMYEQYKYSRTSWGINALGTCIAEIELDNGIKGIGLTIGGEPACYIIEKHLNRFVEGQSPFNTELIWDQMFKSTVNYGRKGLAIQAISAVDLAIWDALGKHLNQPVYNLLGGKTKEKLPVYCTSSRPDISKKLGFVGAKVPLPYGPGDGLEGMEKNISYIAEQRKLVGENFPLMVDCYMSLNVQYTIELAKQLKPYKVQWLEECLLPDDYDGWKQIKNQAGLFNLFTTGEHEYTRYGFRKLLETKSIDVLQPDISWCGGITEARKIVALAASYDIPVVPHGSSIYSYHLQIANTNCPMAEFLNLSPQADKIIPLFGDMFKDEPLPENGYITLSNKPGFGVEFNYDLNLKRPYEH